MPKMKTNHVCKYSGCSLGEDGGAKHYYACDFCDRVNAWRSIACCKEHYDLYIKEVLDARSADKKAKPMRTDMTEKQVEEMFEKPIEEVKQKAVQELKELTGKDVVNIEEAVEEVNAKIDATATTKRKRRSKK